MLIMLLFFASALFGDPVDDKIEKLDAEIKSLRLKAMQQEVEAGENLRSGKKEFVDELQKAESYEDQVEKKVKELEKLKQEKKL